MIQILLKMSGTTLFFLGLAVVPCFSAEEPAPATHAPEPVAAVVTNLPTKASDEEVELLDESTLARGLTSLRKANQVDPFQLALEAARKQRENKDLARAERSFIQLLEGRAPEEIKRPALLDLALVMQEQKSYAKAQRLYSEYTRRFPKDAAVPEVMLRQAYLYRDMGLPELAMSKFFGVMSTSLNLEVAELDYYQKLVLRAQVEIAETYYSQGKFDEASQYLNKILKLDGLEMHRADILYKLVRCNWNMRNFDSAIANARLHLAMYPNTPDTPETRYLLADSLKKTGHDQEAIEEIAALLQRQRENSKSDPEQWLYWQQKAGNDIANQFYRQGDYLKALQVYQNLADLNDSPEWQFPVWYQIGLVYENLKHYSKASEIYGKIVARHQGETPDGTSDGTITTIVEMARWRKDFLAWEADGQAANKQLEMPTKAAAAAGGTASYGS
jgi:tetratricopeptide (TPR) repeat protein